MEEQLRFREGDRRSFPRHRLHHRILVKSPAGGGNAIEGITENMSSSGILLFVHSPLAAGATVELLFDMPTLAGEGHYPVRCLGKIVRAQPSADRYAIAVAFEKVEVVGQA